MLIFLLTFSVIAGFSLSTYANVCTKKDKVELRLKYALIKKLESMSRVEWKVDDSDDIYIALGPRDNSYKISISKWGRLMIHYEYIDLSHHLTKRLIRLYNKTICYKVGKEQRILKKTLRDFHEKSQAENNKKK